MYLIFDTETTGKPKKYDGAMTDLDNWPRVTQLGWQVADENGYVVSEQCFLIKPDGWTIPNDKFFIENGFSTEKSMKEGVEIGGVLDLFIEDYEKCVWLIAHNMAFDYPVLGAEMIRAKKRAKVQLFRYCTKEKLTYFCKIAGKYGHKWPKLEELYRIVFKREMEGAHDALNDVKAVREVFFELKKKGVIVLPEAIISVRQ